MPEKELFSQDLKQTLSLNDRIAVGVPGLLGADNILVSDFIRFTGLTLVARYENNTVIDLPENSKIVDIDFYSEGGATVELTQTDAGDIMPETTFTGKLNNIVNIPYVSPITITTTDTVTTIVRYIINYY